MSLIENDFSDNKIKNNSKYKLKAKLKNYNKSKILDKATLDTSVSTKSIYMYALKITDFNKIYNKSNRIKDYSFINNPTSMVQIKIYNNFIDRNNFFKDRLYLLTIADRFARRKNAYKIK